MQGRVVNGEEPVHGLLRHRNSKCVRCNDFDGAHSSTAKCFQAVQSDCAVVLRVLQALHVLAELTHLTELELGCASPSRCGRCEMAG